MGAVYATKSKPSEFIHVPTLKIDNVVDTTGAGDAFIGSLAYYMARYPQNPLHQQIGAACEMAAYSVQKEGTQSSFVSKSEVVVDLNKKEYEWKFL